MQFIVVSLERSVDRREKITKEFHAHGVDFEFSTAKDKFDLTSHDYEQFADLQSKSINWSHPVVPGLLACYISHQSVWKHCLANDGLDTVAIFEDDATISDKFNHAIRTLESKKDLFDIVFLEKRHANKSFKPLIEIGDGFSLGIVKYRDTGACAYLINRSAMLRLIEQFPKFCDLPIDDILHARWLTNLRTYTLDPPVVFHPNCNESLISRVGHRLNSIPDTADDWSQKWQSLSKPMKWKISYKKRVQYFQDAIGRSWITRRMCNK